MTNLDKALAVISIAGLVAFVGTLMVFVKEPDLIIVCVVVLFMAAFDFYLLAFKKKKNSD